ncbi:MAG: caspase family protein [Burkholderiaceae bacterium]
MSHPLMAIESGAARPDTGRRAFGAGLLGLAGRAALSGPAGFASWCFGAMAWLPARSARAQGEGARVALVIGNADYRVAPLSNPVNDARLVSATLQDLGFNVLLLENGSLNEMVDALRQWLIASRRASVRAFYFAGHGTQFRGRNYLVPVDMAITSEQELDRRALVLADVVDAVSQQREGVNFVIIDACRTAPNLLLGRRTRSLENPPPPGFTPQEAPRGTVVAFSTSPGALAADGVGERNSVFTKALARQLRQPGLPVESLFKRVRVSVMRETGNAQVPWESSSLVGEFCFRPNPDGRCVPG